MVGSFFIMASPPPGSGCWFWRKRAFPASRKMLIALVIASPFGMIALESGWLVTEFGRQPWVVMDVMRVSAGVTPNAGIGAIFVVFLLVYLLLDPRSDEDAAAPTARRRGGRLPGGSPCGRLTASPPPSCSSA